MMDDRDSGKTRAHVLSDKGVLREVVMELLCRQAGLKGSDVAGMFDLHDSAVSKYRKRIRIRLIKDEEARKLWDALAEGVNVQGLTPKIRPVYRPGLIFLYN